LHNANFLSKSWLKLSIPLTLYEPEIYVRGKKEGKVMGETPFQGSFPGALFKDKERKRKKMSLPDSYMYVVRIRLQKKASALFHFVN